jgi:hypothetical protein
MNIRLLSAAAAFATVALLFACKHDDAAHDHATDDPSAVPYPSCRAITEACHELDVGTGPIHDCHDVGHDSTSDAPCAARKDECLKICAPADDAGAADAATGG